MYAAYLAYHGVKLVVMGIRCVSCQLIHSFVVCTSYTLLDCAIIPKVYLSDILSLTVTKLLTACLVQDGSQAKEWCDEETGV